MSLQPLLDEDWAVAIQSEIDSLPEVWADVADAYMVGWLDGEMGEVCQPLTHYIRLGDIESYIIGWKDAAAATAAALDYEEDQLDRDFRRRGC